MLSESNNTSTQNVASDGYAVFGHDGQELMRFTANVSSYRVPYGCKRIAAKAFAYSPLLQSIELPETLESIGEKAFASSELRSIVLPNSVRSIGKGAFLRSRKLRRAQLNEGLVEICDDAFKDCNHLKGLDIPSTVRYLGKNALRGCKMQTEDGRAAIRMSPDNRNYFIDDCGVLYRKGARSDANQGAGSTS